MGSIATQLEHQGDRVAGRRPRKSFRTQGRRIAAIVALLGATALALFAGAGPAGAVIVRTDGHAFGITPVNDARGKAWARAHLSRPSRPRPFDEGPSGGGALEFHGGPVMHTSTTHVVYWDPNKEFSETTKGIVGKYFPDVAHDSGLGSNVFGVNAQFTDATGFAAYSSTFAGALADTTAYPANGCEAPTFEADPGPYTHCLTDKQLRTELSAFVAAKSLPKGPTQFYALLLPHAVVTCGDAIHEECSNDIFCAYHTAIGAGPEEILWANIPWSFLDKNEIVPGGKITWAKGCQDDGHNENIQQPNPDNGVKEENSETRFADIAVKYISHEYSETLTDPLASAWYDANGLENGDKCNGVSADEKKDGIGYDKNAFLPTLGGEASKDNLFNQEINAHHFYTQGEWDNVAKACRMTPLEITAPSFSSSPASPVEGSPVEFKAKATDPYGNQEFLWKFGDGQEATGATVSHSYSFSGKYDVTMTAKDAHTDSTAAPVKHLVTVDELPLASIAYEPFVPTVKANVKFKAEAEDPDEPPGKIETYKWDFGDGAKGEGEKVEHKYKEPGEYIVALVVEDSSKLTAEEVESVTVVDQPTVKAEPASAVGQTGGTLNATVNPNGSFVKECKFQYGKAVATEKEAPCAPSPGSEFAPVAVSATVAGLEAETEYKYRVVAKNEAPEASESEGTFTTLKKLPPAIAAEAASAITQTTATLEATVNPNGAEVTECKVEYGTSVFYEASMPCAALPAGAGTSPVAVSAAIGGLAANTTYHFRAVATNGAGKGEGVDTTFKTAAVPPPPPKEEATKPPPPPPDSSFSASASVNTKSGAITFTATVKDPGTFTALATFVNGKFGVFSASASKCKRGFVRLQGKCRRSKITFSKATVSLPAAGAVTFTLKPTASARRALQFALKHKKGLPVTVTLTFQSLRGGAPASKTITITVKLRKK